MKDTTNNIFITTSCGWNGTTYEVCNGTSDAIFATDCLDQAEFAAHCKKIPDMLCSVSKDGVKLSSKAYGTINKLITKNKLGQPLNKQRLASQEVLLKNNITINLIYGQIKGNGVIIYLTKYKSLSEALAALSEKFIGNN